MSKSTAFVTDLLKLIFNNTALANIGNAGGLQPSGVAGSLYLSLHTADPGRGGTQATSEAAYGGYGRQAVARSGSGWTVSGNQVTLTSAINFPIATSGSETETHWGVGSGSSGATELLYSGVIGTGPSPFEGTATVTALNAPAHGFANHQKIIFEDIEGQSLPTGITRGTTYFVLATGLTTDAFQFSATDGGAAITVSGSGAGLVFASIPIVVATNVTPQLTPATKVVEG